MKKNRINWLHQFVELIVVIIGISLAFMINRAHENHKAGRLEQKFLQSFYDDISKDSEQLSEILIREETTLKDINRLLAMLKKSSVHNDSLMGMLSKMSRYYPFFQNASTYESIKNSGNLNIISDYFLKEEIIKYYQRYEERKIQEQNFSSFLNSYFIPFLFENIDFEATKIVNMNIIRHYKFKNVLLGYQLLLKQNFLIHKSMHEASLALSKEIKTRIQE